MPFRKSEVFQRALCEVLGIDPKQTTRVVIDSRADGVTQVRISQYMTAEQEDEVIRRFELVDAQEG